MPTGVSLALLLLFFPAMASAAPEPPPARQQTLIHLLKHDCGSCHGMTLKGGLGPALLPQNLKGKSDAFLQQTILDGRPNTAMPPWRGMLNEAEVAWLLSRLRQGVSDE